MIDPSHKNFNTSNTSLIQKGAIDLDFKPGLVSDILPSSFQSLYQSCCHATGTSGSPAAVRGAGFAAVLTSEKKHRNPDTQHQWLYIRMQVVVISASCTLDSLDAIYASFMLKSFMPEAKTWKCLAVQARMASGPGNR